MDRLRWQLLDKCSQEWSKGWDYLQTHQLVRSNISVNQTLSPFLELGSAQDYVPGKPWIVNSILCLIFLCSCFSEWRLWKCGTGSTGKTGLSKSHWYHSWSQVSNFAVAIIIYFVGHCIYWRVSVLRLVWLCQDCLNWEIVKKSYSSWVIQISLFLS